jgi:hypothetical protein
MKIDSDAMFAAFASVYPHEAHEQWPDRFWQYFHKQYPGVPREQMEKILKETEVPNAD